MHDAVTPDNATNGADPEQQIAYKIPKAAQLLDLSDRYVWRLVHTGKLPSIKIGTSRRITRQALLDYIEQQRRAAL